MTAVPDCLTCGMCCVSIYDQNGYAGISPADEARLGKKFVRLNVLYPSVLDQLCRAIDRNVGPYAAIKTRWRESKRGPMKGIEMNTCVALRGDVGHHVRCGVYENRPDVCHTAVVPGDKLCLTIRRKFAEIVGADPSSGKKEKAKQCDG